MDKEELMKRGLIETKKEKLQQLEVKIDGLTKEISRALFMFDGVESIEIELAKQHMDELVGAIAEFQKIKTELKKLGISL